MQNYSSSSNLSNAVFFTASPGDTSVYLVSGHLSATGSGDGVNFAIKRNGQNLLGTGGDSGDYIFSALNTVLSEGDELSVLVNVDGSFSCSLDLRLVKLSDELAPLE